MRIALCEDDSAQADMFVRLLDKTADKLGIKAETDVYNCAEDMKEELNDKNIPYDVYFLDIELGDDNGISLHYALYLPLTVPLLLSLLTLYL